MIDPSRSSLVGGLDLDIEFDAPIGALTWFGIGGRVPMLIRPKSEDSLASLLSRCHQTQVPVRILGGGANLLVDDAGVDGVVIRLDHECFTSRKYNRQGEVDRALVAAGSDLFKLVNETARHGLDGISQLAGIPGTLGGAIRMNAGGNFGDTGQVIESVSMLDMTGRRIDIDRDELTFDYRQSSIPNGIVCSAILQLEPTDPVKVRNKVREIFAKKKASQPMADNSAGCAFRNPVIDGQRLSAGQLIDEAGLKELNVGGATVSPRHANFISTTPQATARDVMKLMTMVQSRVRDHCGASLQPEVVIWSDDPEAPRP